MYMKQFNVIQMMLREYQSCSMPQHHLPIFAEIHPYSAMKALGETLFFLSKINLKRFFLIKCAIVTCQ